MHRQVGGSFSSSEVSLFVLFQPHLLWSCLSMRLWWSTLVTTSLCSALWRAVTHSQKWFGPTLLAQCLPIALCKEATSPSGGSVWRTRATTTARPSTMWGTRQRRLWTCWCGVSCCFSLSMCFQGAGELHSSWLFLYCWGRMWYLVVINILEKCLCKFLCSQTNSCASTACSFILGCSTILNLMIPDCQMWGTWDVLWEHVRGVWADFAWKWCLLEEQRTVFLSLARYFDIPNQFSLLFISAMKNATFQITPDVIKESETIQLGQDLKLSCHVDAVPQEKVVYSWYKNGKPARFSDRLLITRNDPELPPVTCSLEIIDLRFSDYGTYLCVATFQGAPIPDLSVEVNISSETGEPLWQVETPKKCLASLAAPQPRASGFFEEPHIHVLHASGERSYILRQALGSDWRWVIVTTSLSDLLCTKQIFLCIFSLWKVRSALQSKLQRQLYSSNKFHTVKEGRKEKVVAFQQISSVPLLRRE